MKPFGQPSTAPAGTFQSVPTTLQTAAEKRRQTSPSARSSSSLPGSATGNSPQNASHGSTSIASSAFSPPSTASSRSPKNMLCSRPAPPTRRSHPVTHRGPLHGIPWGAKDLLDTAGHPHHLGRRALPQPHPREEMLRSRRSSTAAGAVLVAKLSLGALALNDVWFGGQTKNPWLLEEGSSGSSAGPGSAVAAGLVGFAIGSETQGSIVSPSMRCGVEGS